MYLARFFVVECCYVFDCIEITAAYFKTLLSLLFSAYIYFLTYKLAVAWFDPVLYCDATLERVNGTMLCIWPSVLPTELCI